MIVDQRHPAEDESRLFHALDAAPAGRRGEPDALGDLGYGQARIILDQVQDTGIDAI
jgi:hypothetical protein